MFHCGIFHCSCLAFFYCLQIKDWIWVIPSNLFYSVVFKCIIIHVFSFVLMFWINEEADTCIHKVKRWHISNWHNFIYVVHIPIRFQKYVFYFRDTKAYNYLNHLFCSRSQLLKTLNKYNRNNFWNLIDMNFNINNRLFLFFFLKFLFFSFIILLQFFIKFFFCLRLFLRNHTRADELQ